MAAPLQGYSDILRRASVDAFGRIRTSDPLTIFDSSQSYGDDAKIWENALTGTGSVSNLLNESTVQMTTGGTASGAKVIRQTRSYHHYQPSKAQNVVLTFVWDSAGIANVRRRAGYFDANNGIFLEQNGNVDVALTRRTNVTGTPSDADRTVQANWNLDNLSGSGGTANPSGITMDWTKAIHMVLDLEWLGVGIVDIGFRIEDVIVKVHRVKVANVLSTVYMTTASLPIRFELENTGVAAGTVTMRQICAAVRSEGGFEDARGFQLGTGSGATTISVTTRRPVCSIRAKTTGPNSVRNFGHIHPRAIEVQSGGNSCYYELVLNGTLTNASFAAVSATDSLAEFDVAATAISGGNVIATGYCVQSGNATDRGNVTRSLFRDYPMVYTGLGNIQDTLTLVATSMSGTATVGGAFTWQEQL